MYKRQRFYHVVTPQDGLLIDWLKRLGVEGKLRWRGAHTGFYADGTLHRFDTPLDFLRFPPLDLIDKGRLAASILYASRVSDGAPLWLSVSYTHLDVYKRQAPGGAPDRDGPGAGA